MVLFRASKFLQTNFRKFYPFKSPTVSNTVLPKHNVLLYLLAGRKMDDSG